MTNRKTIVVAFMLIAVMVLGVGYAAVSDTLDIQGTADISSTGAGEVLNEDIYFTGVMKGDTMVDAISAGDNLGYTAHINSQDNDMAHFTISSLSSTASEAVIITYVVKNDSTNDVTLEKKNSSTTEAIFTVETELDAGTKTLAAGSTTTVWVKVYLNDDPTDAVTSAFVFGFTATPVED